MKEKQIIWLCIKWKDEWNKGIDLFTEVAVSCFASAVKGRPFLNAMLYVLAQHRFLTRHCICMYSDELHGAVCVSVQIIFLIQSFYKLLKCCGWLFLEGWTTALILCMLEAGPRCFGPKCTCCGSLPEHHTTLSCIQSKGINHDFTTVHQLTYCCFVTGGRKDCCLKPCHRFSSHSSMKACHMPL